jgi:hypothetical protein
VVLDVCETDVFEGLVDLIASLGKILTRTVGIPQWREVDDGDGKGLLVLGIHRDQCAVALTQLTEIGIEQMVKIDDYFD